MNPRTGRFSSTDPFFHAIHGNLNDSPLNILQAGNLFMFVMHNPVRWSDPWGLFAWNEDDDHWFDLMYEVNKAGGTFDGIPRSMAAIISIWGVNLRFDGSMAGVEFRNGRMHVRADLFYSSVVAAATEILFLGAHGGVFQQNPVPHMHISMFISENSHYWNSNAFSNNTRWGNVRYASLSGGASISAHVISVVNSMNYLDRPGLRFSNHLHTGVGMATQLFEVHNYFMTNHNQGFRYALLPGRNAPAYNSTSMVISLLNAVGLHHGMTSSQQRFAIGMGSVIHPRNFGR